MPIKLERYLLNKMVLMSLMKKDMYKELIQILNSLDENASKKLFPYLKSGSK